MNTQTIATTLVVMVVFGSAILLVEQHRLSSIERPPTTASFSALSLSDQRISAAGRVEGRTETVEVRARLLEQIAEIRVTEGDWVQQGDLLITLDAERFEMERDLAAADLAKAQAELAQIRSGARASEIETARNEFNARRAELEGARKTLSRIERLVRLNAASPQMLDDRVAQVASLEGWVAAAENRVTTIAAPPRTDELDVAEAAVRAAKSRLALAEVNLDRTRILSPLEGRVLRINAEAGELTRPDQEAALIVLADTRVLHVVAEVDEFDALGVELGQPAVITSDSVVGVLASGRIVEIEPQMVRKQVFSDRMGERQDSFGRRVWIELKQRSELPIGLPVDVVIDVSGKKDTAPREQ